jgi:hypothetical protein
MEGFVKKQSDNIMMKVKCRKVLIEIKKGQKADIVSSSMDSKTIKSHHEKILRNISREVW